METPVKKTWKSTLAGVLSIVAGVLSSIGFLAMIVAVAAVGSSEVVLDALRDAGFSGGVSLLQTIPGCLRSPGMVFYSWLDGL